PEAFATLEAQASACRNALPQARAPVLAGWSYGALLAWEVARQSERDGVEIGGLVMIDPPLPQGDADAEAPVDFEEMMRRELALGRDADPGRSAALSASPEARAVLAACRANTRRLRAYRPSGRLSCSAFLAVATRRPPAWGDAEAVTRAWREHLGALRDQIALPGTHYDCVLGDNAAAVARLLRSL
ncbi:MAG: alpha/beta fold hydrolase, partial [Allosphingosinicella sp.]